MNWIIGAIMVSLLLIAPFVCLSWYFHWEAEHTGGMAYYGKPLAARRALKRRIRLYSLPLLPIVRLLAWMNRSRATMPVFEYEGVYGPPKVSSAAVFARAKAYRPTAKDVFVVTQMRCGTTWMQQIVLEIVTRGGGDLSDTGYGHLYAASPWIDAVTSVSIDDAPLVGEQGVRIIKSHLPTTLCPYSEEARYIYVTRHPVSCFASIVDYNRSLIGPLMPPLRVMADWFCSGRMYWLPWPQHVDGWWQWAETRSNVLFVHYEEMLKDFPAVLMRLETFLGCTLSPEERQTVITKTSFDYMKEHEELFEMAPPTMFSVTGGEYLKSGKASRHEDVTPAIRQQILAHCRHALADSRYPAATWYPDLAG